jgi:hypothetical protein
MENDERIASVIYGLITLTDKVDSLMQEDGYKRISGTLWAVMTYYHQIRKKYMILYGSHFVVLYNLNILPQQKLNFFKDRLPYKNCKDLIEITLFLVPVLFSSLFVQQNLNQDSFCPG